MLIVFCFNDVREYIFFKQEDEWTGGGVLAHVQRKHEVENFVKVVVTIYTKL